MASYKRNAMRKKVQEDTNLIEDTEEVTMLLALKVEEKKGENSTWYLDSGTSDHMTGDKSTYVDHDTSVTGNVTFGCESKIRLKENVKSTILIEQKDH